MKILGIETSCDETAVAVVEDGVTVLKNTIETSVDEHKKTGGIVPEVAARDAAKKIQPALEKCLDEYSWDEVNAIAVTTGPGLIGSLLVGVETARTLAYLHHKPLIPVHHITGHICANRLEESSSPQFPVLVLTVSGGHNELVLWKSDFEFEKIGYTIDDAAGEAFDKGARILGLGFPGGPEIARVAEKGDPKKYKFPRPMMKKGEYRFSFSGLKTALLYTIEPPGKPSRSPLRETPAECKKQNPPQSPFMPEGNQKEVLIRGEEPHLAASYQEAICETLSKKLKMAAEEYSPKEIHLSGGVSANTRLREMISLWANEKGLTFRYPKKMIYCTDNAAMIAGAAYWKYLKYSEEKWNWKDVEATLKREFF